ncbi:MAG: hypothetical protein PWQ88_922 [Candidatus Methanomethylophilaceae archaeon]|nr:hypothetical protein [Candidatus Methanomethylophilaceae archaeon]MDI3542162.1 hypothetical protein [Candidatus Methanomethylophilaceae archaeon]HIJ00097.1 hypothetical protein [Candidatus Methanomethylophilaceae archaeon]
MDSRKRLQNEFEEILATTFDGDEYEKTYAITDAGLALNDVEEDETHLTTLMANFMSAAEALAKEPFIKLRDGNGSLYLRRINNLAFLAVRCSSSAREEDVLDRMEKASHRVKTEIPWLR